MPSQLPVPTIRDFLSAASKGLRGYRDAMISARRGGGYDMTQGPPALIWSREAARDRDLFRQCYTETSRGADRDRLVAAYYKVDRTPEAYGTGQAVLQRSTGATSGKIYAGQRIIFERTSPPTEYVVTADVDVAVGTLIVGVAVRAGRTGTGTAIDASSDLKLGDETFAAFTVVSLVCSDGTNSEQDDDYLARAKLDRRDNRVGHLTRIVNTCKEQGAYHVVALHAGTFGDANDFGLNHIYVSDANYVSSALLLQNCTVALDNVRVLGCDTQILPMAEQQLSVTAAVTLWDEPSKFNTREIEADIRVALSNVFGPTDTWLFKYDELEGTASRVSDAIQSVDIVTSPTEPAAAFVPSLSRYTLDPANITVSFSAPS